jgi:hypothetical protein
MTQLPLFKNDPIHHLMLMGYSEREAAFLCLAGLQSGFFLRRQYAQFAGRRMGWADTALVEKLIAKGHATAIAACHKTVVYHLNSRPFYTALASGDNRNRRTRTPVSIRSRLMGLDFILDHPGPRYFATEQEKVSYFTGLLGIDRTSLPAKSFRSPDGVHSTTRFFVDKYPICVRDDTPSANLVSFCFIDEGLATCSGFEGYLHRYRALFAQLPHFELIYVASSRALFWEAENLFKLFLCGQSRGNTTNLQTLDLGRLLLHFEDRQRSENGLWDSFDRTKLIRLRDERQEFSGSFFDSLYERWKAGGKEAVQATVIQTMSSELPLNGIFSSHFLRHNYDLFGTTSEAPRG